MEDDKSFMASLLDMLKNGNISRRNFIKLATASGKRPTIKNYKKYGLHISPSPLRGEAGWG